MTDQAVQARQPTGDLELPAPRVKKLIQAHIPGSTLDNDAVTALAKATELFLEKLTEASVEPKADAASSKRFGLAYDDVALALDNWKQCDFITDVVPKRVSGAEAKRLRPAGASPSSP